ncbi:MAG: efflux RND transporter periplasmic adaptor subunit [bacterium]
MRKHLIKNVILSTITILLTFLLLFSISCQNKRENKEQIQENVIPVLVKRAYNGTLESYIESDAKVEYKKMSNISFQVSGRIKDILVQEGERVSKGQLVASLDKDLYFQQLQQAYQATLAAKANYDQAVYNLKIQKVQANSDLDKAQLALKQAEENLKLTEAVLYQAKRDFERYQNLYQQGVISTQQFENTKIQYQNALTNYYNAKLTYLQAKESLKVAKLNEERILIFENQAKAAYSSYLSTLENYQIIKNNYKYTDLLSPVNGIVLKKHQEIGSVVNPGMPIFTIADPQSKIVKCSISDTESKKIKPQSKAFVIFKDKTYDVIISKIYPNLTSIGQAFIEAKFINPNNELTHNDYVNLKIQTRITKGIIILRQAIIYSEEDTYVYVVSNDIAQKRKIKIIDNYGNLSVVEGVQEGEMIVIDGQYFIKDGDKVRAKEDK